MTKKEIEDAERRISLTSKKVGQSILSIGCLLLLLEVGVLIKSLAESPVLHTEFDELEPTRCL